jgi:hypothetical protein
MTKEQIDAAVEIALEPLYKQLAELTSAADRAIERMEARDRVRRADHGLRDILDRAQADPDFKHSSLAMLTDEVPGDRGLPV